MTEKDIREFLLREAHPKISQKIKLLELKKDFNEDVKSLRVKWRNLLKPYLSSEKIYLGELSRLFKKYKRDDPSIFNLITKKEKKNFENLEHSYFQQCEVLKNDNFNKDLIELSKNHKLYPTSLWRYCLMSYVTSGIFIPFITMTAAISGEPYLSHEQAPEIPHDMNFMIKIEEDAETSEPELWIQIFEDTSVEDIRKYWKIVKKYQDGLKELKLKGIKRYYPLENLPNAQKLSELDQRESLSDWEKADELFGQEKEIWQGANNKELGRKETKIKNKVKQIRYQYKKRVNP